MNIIMLSGRIVKENELKYTQNNIPVLSNTIAVRNDYKNVNGEYDSQFINFVAYRNTAEFLNKYTQKGNKVLLEGRWNTRNYENSEGKKVYINEMIVNKIELLENKKQEEPKKEDKDKPFKDFGEEIELKPEDFPW